jgi:hypothetical protein
MKKVFKEIIVLVCVLIVAAVVIIPIILNVAQRENYDTLNGKVEKLPINISSPAYGIILSIPVNEGSTITEGQTLATVQVLDPLFKLQDTGKLYLMQKNILTIRSPASGILGKTTVAPQSTIAPNGTFMQIYTLGNTTIHILLPEGKNISDYSAFSVPDTSGKTKYPLQVLDQIPTNVVDNVPQSTTVYRAKCVYIADCEKIAYNELIDIQAQKKQQQSSFFNGSFFSALFH